MFDYTREKVRQFFWDLRHQIAIFPKASRSKILVVQEEGLGNSILTTPLIRALAALMPPRTIDVLVTRAKGADLVFGNWELVNRVWDRTEFLGRRQATYYADVLECHPRHDLPSCIKYRRRHRIAIRPGEGVDYHWLFEKHEADYLVDLARELGFCGERPPIRKLIGDSGHGLTVAPNTIAIGIGYYKGLRADGRDWSDRHWGNANFIELCKRLKTLGYCPVLVGDQKDWERDGHLLGAQGIKSICGKLTLPQVVDFLSKCQAFIGNDTGLMHVAASVDIPTIGIFVNTNSVKSYPLGTRCVALGGERGPMAYTIGVRTVLDTLEKMVQS